MLVLDKTTYQGQPKCLVALDSIIFGFDGHDLRLLLVQRNTDTNQNTWSLMGGWITPVENLEEAANRILYDWTGIKNVYLEQLYAFGAIDRDPVERTISVAYFALINIEDYNSQITPTHQASWFPVSSLPADILYDHPKMIQLAYEKLRYKAALHPLGFELLPEKFTLPQLQKLYEAIFQTQFDKRNFSRKILSTNLLIKTKEKQKSSKKGAFLYQIDQEKYKTTFESFLNFVPSI